MPLVRDASYGFISLDGLTLKHPVGPYEPPWQKFQFPFKIIQKISYELRVCESVNDTSPS